MLVDLSNAVKVESVPLNFNEFSRRGHPRPRRRARHTVGMRYNPPPNWPPAPPGWTPPPGWQPDPSWGPPPAGWALWVDDAGGVNWAGDQGFVQDAPAEDFPSYAPWGAPPPPKRRTGLYLAIGAIVLALAVVGGVIALAVTRDSSGPVAGPTSTAPLDPIDSDEEAIRAVVDEFEQTWNAGDYDGWSALLCEDMQAEGEFDESAFDDIRELGGRLSLSINTLEIDGDTATANISQKGEDPDDIAFVRESGDWKWCES